MMKPVLLTGGAGYIGSHVTRQLADLGYAITVIDNLSTGFKWALPKEGVELVEGDIRDDALLDRVMASQNWRGVIHLAALTQVEESTRLPYKYYDVNTVATGKILAAMAKYKISNFIFSSTAAVYGNSKKPVSEIDALKPINPYGASKLQAEELIRFHSESRPDFRYVNLRYFNVAGAHPSGEIGQATANATHLIKAAVQAALGHRSQLQIFGTDYETIDGTCVRDYVHVWDLAQAHGLVLQHLIDGGPSETFNVGYGQGFSVKQVVAAIEKECGRKIPVTYVGRRSGDSAHVVANVDKINKVLSFQTDFAGALQRICASAIQFEKRLASRN